MKTFLFTIAACSLFLNTAAAQTPPIDDCPAGAVLHKSLTPLDHDSLLAAYTASFVGLFHRQPSLQPGSGADDGNYWVGISNHYGEYGDSVCRAGWNLYRERQIGGLPTGPADGDLPASFQPGAVPPAPPTPPAPPVPPTTDIQAQLDALGTALANLRLTVNDQSSLLAGALEHLAAVDTRVTVLEARPTVTGCSAAIAGIPIHCALVSK